MFFSAFIGFQGWNSWTPETSILSGMSRSSTAALLAGWLLASFLGGLISILVSRLELSSASRLRAAAFSEAALSEESCANERVASSARITIRNRIRTTLLYRGPSGETGALARPHKRPQKSQAAHNGATWFGRVLRGGGKTYFTKTAELCSPSESGCWASVLGSFPPQYWSSAEYPHGGSWRDRREFCWSRPAYPCPARSDKSCRPERSSPQPGTELQRWHGAGSDRSCIPRCPPRRSRPLP